MSTTGHAEHMENNNHEITGTIAQPHPTPLPDAMDIDSAPGAHPTPDVMEPEPMQPESMQPEPMQPVSSASSPRAEPEDGEPGVAPVYGTRSRNRPASSRPNYADDKELDMEIEATGRYSKSSNGKKNAPSSTHSHVPSPAPDTGVTHTKGGGAFTAINGVVPNHMLVHEGTPDSTAPPSQNMPSKKRKQPGSSTTVAHTAAPSQVTTPKARVTSNIQSRGYVETNMVSFERCGYRLNKKDELIADDGVSFRANDHVYLVCEPPGEPYYLARIMEFLHVNNQPENPVDAVRVNWYYRPKDIQRRVQDTRLIFASMHSDTCPLTSLRGKCQVKHLNDLPNLDEYRLQKDSFWFNNLYDRYMHRYYEVIPTSKVVNVPEHVKRVLDERWKFILVEIGRSRELTSESKRCKRCDKFAASNDSVDCAVCKNTYHMLCVRPPLLKKPARGFAWACAACSRAQDLRMEARHTPVTSDGTPLQDEDMPEEDDEDLALREGTTRDSSAAPEPRPEPTSTQLAQANLWPWRYLGVHSRAEDALDYDDRIFPRATSRLGPRHQANVNVWHGRPVELVKPTEIKKKYAKTASHKKDGKLSKETIAALEADREQKQKRPKWVVDEPPGYIRRGEDVPVEIKGKQDYTAQLTFKMPDASKLPERGNDEPDSSTRSEQLVDEYMNRVKAIAPQYNLRDFSVDFLTKAVEKLQENNYNIEDALAAMKTLSAKVDLKQPELNKEEIKRFEEGVAKHGSELHSVARFANIKEARVVRYYYLWKKTEKGRQIWGTFENRRSKKDSKRIDKDGNTRLLDDVADDHDDSAFDEEKAMQKKRGFECKHCKTRSSRQWRRAPMTAPGTLVPRDPSSKNSKDKSTWLTLALCGRCAYLWRRYAIVYESIEEVAKKIAATGGRASKRRVDEELMRTILEAQAESGDFISRNVAQEAMKAGVEVSPAIVQPEEPAKKKAKTDKDATDTTPEVVPEKKKPVEKPPEPELVPEAPRIKIHPCAVCRIIDRADGDELVKCRDCRLHVHRTCYGIIGLPNSKSWLCDMCLNEHNTQVSTIYECVLCPVRYTAQELLEAPKVSHKKKTDREREKERIEREMLQTAGKLWRDSQEAAGRPVNPREALKRTAWNNWIHITCALWTKEIKFGDAEHFDAAEGVGHILPERYDQVCKVCKRAGLPTVKCHASTCGSSFHVGCAHQAGYLFGFDVQPVKGSRRDAVSIMKLDQETGVVTAGIWCPGHQPSTYVHNILEPTEGGITAMQMYARTYKHVDTSVTGTVRRAAQFNLPAAAPAMLPASRRVSTMNGASSSVYTLDRITTQNLRQSPEPHSPRENGVEAADAEPGTNGIRARAREAGEKKCCTCSVDVSPKWWKIQPPRRESPETSAPNGVPAIDLPQLNGSSALPNGTGTVTRSPTLQADRPMTPAVDRSSTIPNGIVKDEPAESPSLSLVDNRTALEMYQCHKCHVQKRTPPSSPSQIRPRQRSRTEPEAPPPLPPFIAQLPVYPVARPYESPAYAPPPSNPVLPPQPSWDRRPAPAPWPAPYGPPPPNQQSPLGPLYGGPPPFRPDYGSPYSARPAPYPSGPPPPPPALVRPAGPGSSQHSPIQAYPASLHQHPLPSQPPPPRPLSPPRYAHDRPTITSPRLDLNGPSLLSRPFAPDPVRDSPVYAGAQIPRYGPPPPSCPSSQAQNLAQIAQAASVGDQIGGDRDRILPPDHNASPIVGRTAPAIPPSPRSAHRHATPSDAGSEHGLGGRGTGIAPGASASPSLRNLLS